MYISQEHDYEIFIQQDKSTPLMIASHNRHVDVVNVNANLHVQNKVLCNKYIICHIFHLCYGNLVVEHISVLRVSQ